MKKITVGLPVYNGANYLAAAIESILGQTCPDFDLVISDNASTDGTAAICRAYARRDKRIRYIRQPRNIGAAANYNFVAGLCETPYFKWAAHDDLLAPGFLQACLDALESDPSLVLAMPATTLVDEAGMPLPYSPERGGIVDRMGVCWPALPEQNSDLTSGDPVRRFRAVMLNMFMCVEIFGLMRRPALLRALPQGSFSGADKVFLARMSLLGRFWLGPETLFLRRCHAQQFSAQVSGAYRAAWFSGRRDSIFVQQLRLLLAYCRVAAAAELPLMQRCACLYAVAHRAATRGHQWQRLTGAVVGLPRQRKYKPALHPIVSQRGEG
ncbi:MAG TPA: glycosyltransferase family 2 protein [Ferrovibrio sp.]|jgi:glycosyltransferase involved in cell wall biosynthesis|uniref:glycosyltransferase family 2 protein n=1 Tax=Ferrovibrio sp. TaxID=1917215 RepID=UPI002B4ABF19|nr:glycosyltransferase family 2 protein [Ferrovibrio sp.]HLT76229.1 glycosyltransferase family 2 protein [Ferrovibrio sp.]